nr:hypothetical protein GCM10020092_071680 [Actinoplanes digitatis]
MISDVHRLRRAFDEAELRADTGALNALLAEDFRSIGEQGHVLDKAQWIGKFAEFSYAGLESSDVEVCCYPPRGDRPVCSAQPLDLARARDGAGRPGQPDLGRAAGGLAAGRHPVQHPQRCLRDDIRPGVRLPGWPRIVVSESRGEWVAAVSGWPR